jgi:hypothetical protein
MEIQKYDDGLEEEEVININTSLEEDREKKVTRHVEKVFEILIGVYEDAIYRSWTTWYPDPKNRGAVSGLVFLLDTILYEPIQFSMLAEHTLEIFQNRPTFRIDITNFAHMSSKTPQYKKLQKLLKQMTSDLWKLFFEERVMDSMNAHHKRYTQFKFNRLLEGYFKREDIVHKLIIKLLFRAVCFKDDGFCWMNAVRVIEAALRHMSLNTQRLSQQPDTLLFIGLMDTFISQPGLYSGMHHLSLKHFRKEDEF